MFQDFPEVKNLKYNIKDINEEIASDSGVAAYFNIPSIDGDSIKQLRVNPKSSDIKSLSTYSTVSHEGFPVICINMPIYMKTSTTTLRKP